MGTLILLVLSITLFYPDKEIPQPQVIQSIHEPQEPQPQTSGIATKELARHNTKENCWIIYEGKVYDYSGVQMHPNMAKAFFSHCGQPIGFEEGAKSQHSGSSESRVSNYGNYIGDLSQ